MSNFVVSYLPFKHSKNDINRMFLYISMALIVPAIFGVTCFGVTTLLIILASVVSCFVFESFYNLINSKIFLPDNFSFFVTGMILALTLPVKTPIWVVIVSAFFAIFVTKMAFGGLGRNCINPGLAGRCVAGLIYPTIATTLSNFVIAGDEYVSLASGGFNTINNILLGYAVGGVGTTCIVIILVCLIVLSILKITDFKIPVMAMISYFIVGTIIFGVDNVIINMFSGSFIFVCVFMLTDPNTSPDTFIGKAVYSCLFGALSALVWKMGMLGENTIFAVALFVNFLVPYIDRFLVWRPIKLGGYRNAYKN